jgi:hypothetical protein
VFRKTAKPDPGAATAIVSGAKDRVRDTAATLGPIGKRAGTSAAHGVQQGVHAARGWAAPHIDHAADALSDKVAPKVSGALKATAGKVQPAGTSKGGLRSLLSWKALLGIFAALAAAGAAAAFTMRSRYQKATAGWADEDEAPASADDGTNAPKGNKTDAETSDSDVNGRVRSPR